MNILFLIGGLILILLGANGLTDGAASVAKRFRIPSIVIGLTIVAFGTSAPELTVSVSSALKGSAVKAVCLRVLFSLLEWRFGNFFRTPG